MKSLDKFSLDCLESTKVPNILLRDTSDLNLLVFFGITVQLTIIL